MDDLLRVLQSGGIVFARGIQGRLAYARYFVLDLAAFFISSGLALLLWLYVDGHKPGGLAIPRAQLIAYMTLALVVNHATTLWGDSLMGARIRSGQIATDLLKPIDAQWLYFAGAMADAAVQAAMGLGVILLAFWVLPQPPLVLEPARLAVFGLSLGLGLLVQYGLVFFLGLGAFVTHNGYGLFYLRLMSHAAFSGIFAPLLLYPAGLRRVAEILPFHCVVHTPVALGLGLLPLDQAPRLLLEQAAWAAGLIAVGQAVFRLTVRRLSVQGG